MESCSCHVDLSAIATAIDYIFWALMAIVFVLMAK